ncbi:MAG: BglII/BstYI family type II restriction endonuclease [Armatimonadota bacterium]
MRIVYEYSHLGGLEILTVRYPDHLQEIIDAVRAVKPFRSKVSREKSTAGKRLYSPVEMNRQFREIFAAKGYREIRDVYTITLPGSPIRIPGAFKQIDFVKDRVLVEVQFGKYAFMFYDMAKFQYFFNENKADVGVEIVPCYALHKEMSTGVSYGEQLVYDIERLRRHFPAVPVYVLLVGVDTAHDG